MGRAGGTKILVPKMICMVEVPVEEWSRYADPSTETYKLEVIAQQTTAYSVSVSTRSKKFLRLAAFNPSVRRLV